MTIRDALAVLPWAAMYAIIAGVGAAIGYRLEDRRLRRKRERERAAWHNTFGPRNYG